MNRNLRCMAIDDEPLALDIIKKFCERMGGIELEVFSDPGRGREAIARTRPDLVFLDIEMESETGLAIASSLPETTCFIFTTAYLDYALDGFNLDAVDYLHKPYSFSRFKTAVEKAVRRIGYLDATRMVSGSIVVKKEYSNVRISLGEILYVEAMEGYCKIFKTGGECVVSRLLLKNISAMLPPDGFMRIHRSYIVSRSKVTGFTRQSVTLGPGVVLPVGRQYAAEVAAALG